MTNTLGPLYWKELEAEGPATRKCLERVPATLYDYKPHEKSMITGYLCAMLAEMPNWIATMLESDIDFATYKMVELKSPSEMIAHFDKVMEKAKKVLMHISDADFEKTFHLKNKGEILMSMNRKDSVSSTINHLVHHRGQLTVYMRLNDIPVPALYGPSADEKEW